MGDHTVHRLLNDNILHGLMVLPYSAWTHGWQYIAWTNGFNK